MENKLKAAQLRRWFEAVVLVVIIVLFLSAGCLQKPPPVEPPPPPPKNQLPVVHVTTSATLVDPSTECLVSSEASDADGDTLSYLWSAPEGGMIKGEGDSVTWVAPDAPGDYIVRVLVKDGKGGEAIASVTISVAAEPNQLPTIVSLTEEGSKGGEEREIKVWRTATIECIAEDLDGDALSFVWASTGGRIQGEGNKVAWTAPGVAGNYTVTVIVRDNRGGEATDSLTFSVYCCGN